MKQIYFTIIFTLAITLNLPAQQTSWQWVNPLPQGNILNSIAAINQDTIFLAGNYGTILKTINGGKTWQVTPTAAGTSEALFSANFISGSIGWVVGGYGTILKTTDAGKTWFPQNITTTKDLFTSDFVSASIGWVAGAQGTIYKTTDGGSSWNQQISGITGTIYGITFFNSTTGWAVGTDGNLIGTTDGGTTWALKTTNTTQNLYGIQFISASVGYAIGAFGTMIKSTDGGNTWIPLTSGTDFSLYGIDFASPLIGYALGSFGTSIKTTNGGFTWFQQNSNTYNDLYAINFSSTTTGWAVGDFGTIVATTDGGINWFAQSSGTKNVLNGISFATPSLGVAVGEEGSVTLSTDGGSSWNQQSSGILQTLWGVHMLNSNTGWAVGDSAVIVKTTTSGATWTEQNSHTDLSLYSVNFVNSTNGWAVGDFGTILATVNGGLTWKAETSNVVLPLMRIQFLNTSLGWAVGYGGIILKTTNGGSHWISQVSNTSQTLYALSVIDANTVFASGDFGTIVSTTDGGTTWTETTIDGWSSLYGIAFLNNTIGWACGDNGTIMNTTNGGISWAQQNTPTQNTLWDILLIKSTTGGGTLFAAGQGGTLICSAVYPLPIRTWTGATDSMWTNASNWNPIGVPEKGDSVYIPLTAVHPVYKGVMQQLNLGGLRIASGTSLAISAGLVQLVVSGTIKIDGTLNIDSTSSLEIITGDNFTFGANGNLIPGQSTVMISNIAQIRGSYYNLFISENANTQSAGNIIVKNNLTLHSNISLRPNDTLTIQNPEQQGLQGLGFITAGTIKRAIDHTTASEYRFESPVTFVRFYQTGTLPDTVLMTCFPKTYPPGLSDTIFVKRYYSVSSIGGNNYLSYLSLRYDTSETKIPIDNLGLFRDSSGIIFNMGVSDYLDSDVVAIDLDSISKFSTWYIGRSDYTWKHPQQFFDTLIVHDNGASSDTLVFGTAPGATDGIDSYLQEVPLGATPTPGFFDARWIIPSTDGTKLDVRNIFTYNHQQIIFTCMFQPGSGGYPMTLRWDSTAFPVGTAILKDEETGGNKFSINMRNQSSYTITDVSVKEVLIDYLSPTYYSFKQGWNMVSIPVNLRSDNNTTTLFPTATSNAFGFNYQYYSADTLSHGLGYWLKFASQQYIPLDGTATVLDTIPVQYGWNMIGSIGSPLSTSRVQQIPSSIVISDYFFFNTSYTISDSIKPSNAYWVKVKQAGKLVLSKTAALTAKMEEQNSSDMISRFNSITISNYDGASQTLYFGEKNAVSENFDRYELPPIPPNGIFDARFSSQRWADCTSDESPRLTLKLQSNSYPVTINWNIKQSGVQSISLFDAATGKKLDQTKQNNNGIVRLTDKSINSIIIQPEASKTIPKEFSLKQNYPNPFNPSTMIAFSLPIDAIVSLKVYNILGQEVGSLINAKPMEAGQHQVEFNSNNLNGSGSLSSGLYFYRISAKSDRRSFADVKKMLLLK